MQSTWIALPFMVVLAGLSIYNGIERLVSNPHNDQDGYNGQLLNFSALGKVTNGLYLLETSGRSTLSAIELCSMESAAKHNADRHVHFLLSATSLRISNHVIQRLQSRYEHLHFVHLPFQSFISSSSLGDLWPALSASRFFTSHLSDLLRFLLLKSFGGTYLDSDQIHVAKMPNLASFVGVESKKAIGAGVIHFESSNHSLLNMLISELNNCYNGNEWGVNGPGLITRLLERECHFDLTEDLTMNTVKMREKTLCKQLSVLDKNVFYSVSWQVWFKLFDPFFTSEMLNESFSNSVSIHTWGAHSRAVRLYEQAFISQLAKENCPIVHETMWQ